MNGPKGEEDGPGLHVAYSRSGEIALETIAAIETMNPDQAITRATRRVLVRTNTSRQVQNITTASTATSAALRVDSGSRERDRWGSALNRTTWSTRRVRGDRA